MIEIGDGASLGPIFLGIFGLFDQLGVRHLDGHTPPQLDIASQKHPAKPPAPQ